MVKLVVFAALLVAIVQALPVPEPQGFGHDPIFDAANSGNWDEVNRLLKEQSGFQGFSPDLAARDVKSLRPDGNGKVFGESTYSFKTSSNVNGEKTENSGGHRVVNDNGKVREYDFEPTF